MDCAQNEQTHHDGGVAPATGIESTLGFETIVGSALTGTCFRRETVLLVEDQVFVRKATAEALESAGYRVVLAGSAAHARVVYRQGFEGMDLLLTDIVMPGTSGFELAAEIAVLCPKIRLLLMSGYVEQLTSCKVGPYREQFIAKPFSVPTLLRRVREVLDASPSDCGALA